MKARTLALLTVAILLPFTLLAANPLDGNLHTIVTLISVFNTVLIATSVISIIQFIAHKDHNRTPFQLFNLIFIILFYSLSIPFLLNHKEFYPGFEQLSDVECLKKYFLDNDVVSWIRKVVLVAFLVNIIYIARFARTYYLE